MAKGSPYLASHLMTEGIWRLPVAHALGRCWHESFATWSDAEGGHARKWFGKPTWQLARSTHPATRSSGPVGTPIIRGERGTRQVSLVRPDGVGQRCLEGDRGIEYHNKNILLEPNMLCRCCQAFVADTPITNFFEKTFAPLGSDSSWAEQNPNLADR